MALHHDLSPEEPSDLSMRLFQIKQFWEQLDVSSGEPPGETTWEELEKIKSEVFAALAAEPKDVTHAESLTAYAGLLMAGFNYL